MEENELTNQYFRYVKICGSTVGLWPFQTGWRKTALRGFIYCLFTSAVFTQGSRMVLFYSFDTIAEQIPFVCVALIAFTKYINYVLQSPQFAKLLKELSMDWRSINTEETTMMQMYVKRAVLFSFLYKLNVYFACITFGSLPLIPRFLDIVKPLNESRAWLLIYPAYYYVDESKYYYILLCHTAMCMLAAAIALVYSDSIIIYLVQHACSLLHVTGHRFKHAMDSIQECKNTKSAYSPSDITRRKLCISVQSHNRAISLISEIESVYALNLFVQVGFAIVTFTITLVMIAVKTFTPDMLPVYGFILVQIVHLLFLTIQGQFVINSYDSVYDDIYAAKWYNAHPRLQAFYVLALRNGLTPKLLTAGGLIQLDLDSFAEIVKASVSYYTVLASS